jgi:hypothetical protein
MQRHSSFPRSLLELTRPGFYSSRAMAHRCDLDEALHDPGGCPDGEFGEAEAALIDVAMVVDRRT